MGYRVSWIARAGTSAAELLDLSQLRITGERHEFLDVGWYLLDLSGHRDAPWVMLIADGSEYYSKLDPADAEVLSKGGNETLYFYCSETVMVTDLMCFKNGRVVWAIQYDCGDESRRPEMTGDVPAIAHEILAALRAEQQADTEGGADYIYDITAELGRRLIGFRHDKDLETDDPEPFQVLSEPSTPRAAWWQFWKR